MKRYVALLSLFFIPIFAGDALSVSCVRDDAKEVVTCKEKKLGELMWEDGEQRFLGTYEQARGRCERLVLAGYEDWRLPSIDELLSVADKALFNPALNQAFKHLAKKGDFVWYHSRTKSAEGALDAWIVNFKNGSSDLDDMNNNKFVRCVRDLK